MGSKWEKTGEFEVNGRLVGETQKLQGDLSRRVKILLPNVGGVILCACDGTSRAIRDCLLSTKMCSALSERTGQQGGMSSLHLRIVDHCNQGGLKRIHDTLSAASRVLNTDAA